MLRALAKRQKRCEVEMYKLVNVSLTAIGVSKLVSMMTDIII